MDWMRSEEGMDWVFEVKTNFQISAAVWVSVWAEKQRNAPGLSNELSKK